MAQCSCKAGLMKYFNYLLPTAHRAVRVHLFLLAIAPGPPMALEGSLAGKPQIPQDKLISEWLGPPCRLGPGNALVVVLEWPNSEPQKNTASAELPKDKLRSSLSTYRPPPKGSLSLCTSLPQQPHRPPTPPTSGALTCPSPHPIHGDHEKPPPSRLGQSPAGQVRVP